MIDTLRCHSHAAWYTEISLLLLPWDSVSAAEKNDIAALFGAAQDTATMPGMAPGELNSMCHVFGSSSYEGEQHFRVCQALTSHRVGFCWSCCWLQLCRQSQCLSERATIGSVLISCKAVLEDPRRNSHCILETSGHLHSVHGLQGHVTVTVVMECMSRWWWLAHGAVCISFSFCLLCAAGPV